MDEDSLEVWRNGEPIRLSATEFKLLRFMMINEERVISKAQILSYVWNVDFASDSRNVEIYVHYLRRKLNLPDEQLIRTIRGVGYQLRSQ
ncbi:transcriptional regulator [Lentzea flaviverrucosa]|uniref:Two-component system, OmpR family, response regulator n=2 Tax=Lentzea flaviverrucosa TaxID=200379 RepID=A0A1H9XSG4_9PSEU|nr:transcriptional regulator [Lentzea flaviverrucosa]SES49115.1 two-component system, OmpR family, response regulator [Lentzea flaviverrucosa]